MSEEIAKLIEEQKELVRQLKEAYIRIEVLTRIEQSPGELDPDYEEQLKVAQYLVGQPGDGVEGEDALKLISLLCQVTIAYRKKKPGLKPYEVMEKVYHRPVTPWLIKQYTQMSILTEIFITPNAVFDLHGYRTVSEMVQEINRIMDLQLPF